MWNRARTIGLIIAVFAALAINQLRREEGIETEIEIAAPPAVVWRVLTEFEAYPDWNPLIRRITGPAREGAELDVVLRLPGADAGGADDMSFQPTLLTFRPGREMRWLGRLWLPGIFDAEHWFLLEGTAEGKTRLRHGEDFSGLLVFIMNAEETLAGFQAMNEALKQRAEALAGGG